MVNGAVQVGTVRAITRFPVKSMAGEALDRVELDHRGLVGDRVLALRTADGGLGSGKTSRRFRALPGLRLVQASTGPDGVVRLRLPDGRVLPALEADGVLSELVGQPVSVVTEGAVSHFDEDGLHLVTTASLRAVAGESGVAVDPRRTRANFLLEVPGRRFAEDDWQGRELGVGSAT
ncbi:MAG: MOSC N-terminal beta barrel domain-containing protein, partial [Mycobacteriaceae bacterium]